MKTWLLIIGFAIAVPALSQHRPAEPMAHARSGHSAYAEMRNRSIKALSDAQVADLRAGKGMSLALPAELNGYPGPLHALELADPLGLGPEQVQKTQELIARMQGDARRLGEQYIAGERDLDRLFREGRASIETVQEAAAKAARAQGELRAAHLRYHLLMMDVLTPEQVTRYNELRGYS